MSQITSRDDIKKIVSEHLKLVDQFIRAGTIDSAIRELIYAQEIDPGNPYIRAYGERLAYLKQEYERNTTAIQTRKEIEQAARKQDEERRRKQEDEQKKREEEQKRQEERNKIKQESLRMEEARQAELKTRLHPGLQGKKQVETILIIDDDKEMLQILSETLAINGYKVAAVTTSDEAYGLLKQWTPRLILCDVNLETSTMGGFSFYEKIRDIEHLNTVPFIFLSGLNDDVIIRTGKELGVDDYLTKPITEQNLIASVKGKLKRFRMVK
jgi:CheY-like chemotaxis protein